MSVTIDLGDAVTIRTRFANASGVLTDPTTISLAYTSPAGVTTTIGQGALTHVSTGIWAYTFVPSAAGAWAYTFTGTGTVVAVDSGFVIVGGSTGPCDAWATIDQLLACNSNLIETSEIVLQQALDGATDLLWRWSGFQYPGICRDSVRPCAQNSEMDGYFEGTWPGSWGFSAGWGDWSWFSGWGSCSCNASVHRSCGCTMLSEIRLGRAPVVAILAVKVDGVTLPTSEYRLDDREWLVSLGDPFPCCQDLTLDDTHQGTFSVSYLWGREAPASGVNACVDLAAEAVKQCTGGDCAVPERVARMDRQGTSLTFISPEQFGKVQGTIRAGIKSVDLFLSSQPTWRPAVIMSPDIDADVRRTGT